MQIAFRGCFGFFYNQKLKSDLSRELVAHCDPGDQLQLRIMYLGSGENLVLKTKAK